MASISNIEQPQMQQIDLMKLNLQQLTQLKNQLDQVRHFCKMYFFASQINHLTCELNFHDYLQELTIFQDSLQTLKMAKGKYGASKEALEQFKEGWESKTTLIPLTGSM